MASEARALTAQLSRASSSELLCLIVSDVSRFNLVHVATSLHRLAKSRPLPARPGGSDSRWKRTLSAATALTHAGQADEVAAAWEMLCERGADLMRHNAHPVSARSLTSLVWALGRLGRRHRALLEALTREAHAQLARRALDAFGIANVAWALASLHAAEAAASTQTVEVEHSELLDALAEAACRAPEAFKPQETTNLLWAFATLGRRHERLFDALGRAAAARMAEFTPQGLSQTLWASAKLGLAKHDLLAAAAAAALPRLGSYDVQSIATLSWAFASCEYEHRALMAAVCRVALARPGDFDAASCSQLLWALSRLHEGVVAEAVSALSQRLRAVAADGLQSQQLLYALGALAKLPAQGGGRVRPSGKGAAAADAGGPALASLLCGAAADAAPSLTANKLGIAAWALGRPAVLRQVPASVAEAWLVALRHRCAQVAEHLNWRTVGHIELALRALGDKLAQRDDAPTNDAGTVLDEDDELVRLLTTEAARSVETSSERAARLNSAPAALLTRCAPWSKRSPGGSRRFLLAGFDPDEALDDSVRSAGWEPVHWRRFAATSPDSAAAPWPPVDAGSFGAGAMRWPWYAAGEAALMMLHAMAVALPPGAPLWIAGNFDEGASGAPAAAFGCFGDAKLLAEEASTAVYAALRSEAGVAAASGPRGKLAGWRADSRLNLPGAPSGGLPWTIFPGLFAGGGLDVMTSALLASLPVPPRRRARILDACCGSGTIAAALGAAHGNLDLRLDMLDADAVAVEAARCNVPAARRVMLCATWPHRDKEGVRSESRPRRYDWIVSNPPVHRGQPDSFEVVIGLIRGARKRLRSSGVLWIVAQEQVPIGRMLQAYGRFACVRAIASDDGRFVTWSAEGKRRKGVTATDGPTTKSAEREQCEAATPTNRNRATRQAFADEKGSKRARLKADATTKEKKSRVY